MLSLRFLKHHRLLPFITSGCYVVGDEAGVFLAYKMQEQRSCVWKIALRNNQNFCLSLFIYFSVGAQFFGSVVTGQSENTYRLNMDLHLYYAAP